MIFYHVDRIGELEEGDVLELESPGNLDPVLGEQLRVFFPDGQVSKHGWRYLIRENEPDLKHLRHRYIEMVWEYERRLHFKQRPSRLRSWFACATDLDAECWQEEVCPNGPYTMWEVEAESWFRADQSWLAEAGISLATSFFAHQYWRGEPNRIPGSIPVWEYLLSAPITVVRCVTREE